jgi:hypothetical protein
MMAISSIFFYSEFDAQFIIIIINRLQTVRVYSRPQTFSIPCAPDQVDLMSPLSSSRSLLAVCRCLSICQCTGDIVCVVFLSL